MEMTSQDGGIDDIFKGAEQIEIFGKLPALLWAYIDSCRKFIDDLNSGVGDSSEHLEEMEKLLSVLNSAADHLRNKDLRERLGMHSQILESLPSESTSPEEAVESLTAGIASLEEIAGPRPEPRDGTGDKGWVDLEIARAEKIKTGRSADVIVSLDVLEDVRSYLAKEVMTEGISSILVIDNAGSLIVNIGGRIELDVISLAAVAAANFAATEQIARLIGESDFVLLFYKGHSESFHFSRVGSEYIIVTIFDNSLSLGLLRLKIAEVSQVLETKLPKREV
jgi:predicted regulator of Ras-like GTPase activity (Roadblock/LC7/MglB family)